MANTDDLLAALAAEPLPQDLHAIEPQVMARLGQILEQRAARRSLVIAGAIAVLIGAGSGLAPATSASAAEPLLGVPLQAPSNLLGR